MLFLVALPWAAQAIIPAMFQRAVEIKPSWKPHCRCEGHMAGKVVENRKPLSDANLRPAIVKILVLFAVLSNCLKN